MNTTPSTLRRALLIGLLAGLLRVSADLQITNPSFENATADGGETGTSFHLIDDWFEALEDTDGATISDDSSEQAITEGGNRPDTAAGVLWGHFIDRNSSGYGTSQIYQRLGTRGVSDPSLYSLQAVLGDRSNRDFAPIVFSFFRVDAGGGVYTPADGTRFTDAFDTEAILDSHNSGDPFPAGETGVVGTSAYSHTFDLSGAAVGDEIWLLIDQQNVDGSLENHSLIDDLRLIAIPEPGVLSTLLAGLVAVLLLRRRG